MEKEFKIFHCINRENWVSWRLEGNLLKVLSSSNRDLEF